MKIWRRGHNGVADIDFGCACGQTRRFAGEPKRVKKNKCSVSCPDGIRFQCVMVRYLKIFSFSMIDSGKPGPIYGQTSK